MGVGKYLAFLIGSLLSLAIFYRAPIYIPLILLAIFAGLLLHAYIQEKECKYEV